MCIYMIYKISSKKVIIKNPLLLYSLKIRVDKYLYIIYSDGKT